jgi:methylmalonyl-CoA mutase N-terminal domain/subunit
LGGTQSLHTNSRDEALALPTEESVQVALRTQQIIAYESGVADTVDPLAGSYFVEHLTDEVERGARAYLEKIEALGGALRAIEQGYIQQEIQDAAYRAQRAVETGEQIVVGVNQFASGEEPPARILRVDEAAQAEQIERVRRVRQTRDQERAAALLARLEEAARAPAAPLMPLFVECVENYVTLGEMCDVLRRVFGEYRPEAGI